MRVTDRTGPFLWKEKLWYSHFHHSVFESVCSVFIKFSMNIMSVGHWCHLTVFQDCIYFIFVTFFIKKSVSTACPQPCSAPKRGAVAWKQVKKGILYKDRVEICWWQCWQWWCSNLIPCNIEWIHILIFPILYFKLFSLDVNHKCSAGIHSYVVHLLQWCYRG